MQKLKQQPLLVHLTNIPTPYRIAFCNTLQKALATYGYELHVLYCAEKEANRHWEVSFDEMQYSHEVLPGISPKVGVGQVHLNLGIMRRLHQLQPQILLVAGSWNMPTALLASSQRLSGSSLRIFWSEGHADAVIHSSGIIAWLRRRCLLAYNAFAVPNQSSARFLEMELGFRPITLPLPNTVDDTFYRVATTLEKEKVRQELSLPLEATIFVSVTRLDEVKGVRELVAAMAQLNTEQSDMVLILVGEGPLRGELENASQESNLNICFVGQQNALGVRNYLAAADAFVLCTKQDPNPLAVIEAAFSGLPLLVSYKAGNIQELVHDGFSGIVIPKVESFSIAEVLMRFFRLEEAERRRLGIGSLQLAEAGFQRQEVAEQFVVALLDQLRVL